MAAELELFFIFFYFYFFKFITRLKDISMAEPLGPRARPELELRGLTGESNTVTSDSEVLGRRRNYLTATCLAGFE